MGVVLRERLPPGRGGEGAEQLDAPLAVREEVAKGDGQDPAAAAEPGEPEAAAEGAGRRGRRGDGAGLSGRRRTAASL